MATKREYNYKDVEMLTAAGIIVKAARNNLKELLNVRPNWKDPFFPNLQERIDKAFDEHLGIDPKKDLREATAALNSIFAPAKKDLALFKTQIEVDFDKNRPRRDEILKNLGFKDHLKDVQKGDQEALIELLYKFKKNMIRPLESEIIAKGVTQDLINRIKGYADTLKKANVSQEDFKGSTKNITEKGIMELNAIYDTVSGVAKIAAKHFHENPALKSQFSYSAVVKKLNTGRPDSDAGNDTSENPDLES